MGYVVYYRVSTKKQGESGLGLDAQKRDVSLFLSSYANNETPIAEFTDVASGSDDTRTGFNQAIELCKQHNHTLLVSKLDRISRKMSTIASLMDIVKIKVACMPHADNFQLHIFAALAQQEREFISIRTKAALQEAKARGVKLGGNNRKRNATMEKKVYSKMLTRDSQHHNLLVALRKSKQTYEQMAHTMNGLGIKSPRGKELTAATVHRMCVRLDIHIA